MTRLVSTFAAALALAVVAAGAAQANSTRLTRGDAEARFQAPLNGGSAIRLHGGDVLEGAPVQTGGRIGPFGEGAASASARSTGS
jgi:hypothetical protein